ncbi:11842_t:CDS:1, partial [Scutellospora calospora]
SSSRELLEFGSFALIISDKIVATSDKSVESELFVVDKQFKEF